MTRADLLNLPTQRFHAVHKFKLTCGIEDGSVTPDEVIGLYGGHPLYITIEDLQLWRRACIDVLKATALVATRRPEKPPHPKAWITGKRRYSKRRAA